MLLSTNKVAPENIKVKVDVQDYLLANLDSIISLASRMHVAWLNSHELHHMSGLNFKSFSNLTPEVNWG